jgi:antitoxin HicB
MTETPTIDTHAVDTKTVDHYMALPYTVVLRPDLDEKDFVARVVELPGCSEHGDTPEKALHNLDEAKRLWITTRLESGLPIPSPEPEEELPSGKFVLRVPRTLHKKLVKAAEDEDVSLNQLVTSILSESVGGRTAAQSMFVHYGASSAWPLDTWEPVLQLGGYEWRTEPPPQRERDLILALNVAKRIVPRWPTECQLLSDAHAKEIEEERSHRRR